MIRTRARLTVNEGAGFNGTDGNIGVAASVVAGVGVGVTVELGIGVTVELGVCVDVVPLTTLGGGVTVGFTVGEGVGTGFSAGVGEGVGAAVRGGGAALTMRGRVLVGAGVGFTDCALTMSGGVNASTHTDTILVSKVGWFFIKLQASQVG